MKQLQAGADESHHRAPAASDTTFRPVVALHRFDPKMARRTLRARVVFRDREEPIRVLICGPSFGRVLET